MDAVILTIQSGVPVARIGISRRVADSSVNAYSRLDLPERPTLFLEFHGSEAGVAEQAGRFGKIAEEFGGLGFDWPPRRMTATSCGAPAHDSYYAVRQLRPGCKATSPTPAFRFRASPKRYWKPRRISPRAACSRPSSVMSATATSTSPSDRSGFAGRKDRRRQARARHRRTRPASGRHRQRRTRRRPG